MIEKLKRYKAMLQERDYLKAKLEEIETSLYFSAGQRLSDMPSAASAGNSKEDLAIKHIELQAKYKAIKAELDKELQEVEDCLAKLTNPIHRNILRLRYIDGVRIAKICEQLNYSRRQIYRYEKTALALLEEKEK